MQEREGGGSAVFPPEDTRLSLQKRLLDLHNEVRRVNNQRPLSLDKSLNTAAMLQANHIAKKRQGADHQWEDHKGPKLGSQSGAAIYDDTSPGHGPRWKKNRAGFAENLGQSDTVDDVVGVTARWCRSSGHKENMISRDYTRVGFGMCSYNNGVRSVTYWVANFSGEYST